MHCLQDGTGPGNELLYAAFNQDSGCFACGNVDGFAVYNVDPFRETFRRVFTNGGIGIVEMLFRCNLLAIVGGGRNPRYPPNKVMIWDDHENKCIGELMFKSEVYAVRLRRERVVVVLNSKVFVYRFKDLKLIHEIKTVANPRGLVSQSVDSMSNILAIPGSTRGSVRVELFDIEKATLIKAHDAELAQFALNFDGTRLATASDKGTLIRLWDTHTGEPLRELRRGTDRAEIYCISFNLASTFLACSSDKGTVHIFSLAETNSRTNPGFQHNEKGDGSGAAAVTPSREGGFVDRERGPGGGGSGFGSGSSSSSGNSGGSSSSGSALSPQGDYDGSGSGNKSMGLGLDFLRKMLPEGLVPKYFASEWSFAQVRGIEDKSICAFVHDTCKLAVVSADGTFLVANFEDGGEAQRVLHTRFAKQAAPSLSPRALGDEASES